MVLIVLSSKEMIVGIRFVQLAAIWHWYLPLWFVCFFVLFFAFLLFPHQPGIDNLEWSTIQACANFKCLFNKGNAEGTNVSKMCLMSLCLCIVLYLRRDRFANPSPVMHVLGGCGCVCVSVRGCASVCACVWGGGGWGGCARASVCVCTRARARASVCVWGGGGEGVIKCVYPYIFVSAQGSYEIGRHK